jgi:glycyl-tRNA synthetase beta chain
MMSRKNLLVELFVEELPPKALRKLGDAFASGLTDALRGRGLIADGSATTAYASPRRLAAHITAVAERGADRAQSQKLMPVSVGLDANGAPTPALVKKLASLGAGPEAAAALRRQPDGKAEALFFDSVLPGATLAEALQKSIEEALGKLPIPKVMGYQLADGWTSVHFVRPAHGLVALHGADVVPATVLGLQSGRTTRGHRFEAAVDPVTVRDADSYAAQMEAEGAVIPGFAARRAEIERQLRAAAATAGLTPIEDDALLDEVAALVERPNVLTGRFEEAFLDVPQECLILTMKANQKYFPLLDAGGRLTNRFLIVSNIRPADASAVVGGNERVVRPRLADAKFFFDQDRKKTLASRVPGLARVVYHNKLGTQGERGERVRSIARAIGQHLGGAELAAAADQAANLAKADLLTDMVGEFPELQGIMGGYYARHDGIDVIIAEAIEDHYKPRFAGDALPRNPVGVVTALADKLETLTGLFSIGEKPSGDRDPFALRRHALGVIRMLVERELDVGLDTLIGMATEVTANAAVSGDPAETRVLVASFIYDRLANQLREQGYTAQEVDAVLALRPARLMDVPRLIEAVRAFAAMSEAAPLAAANKRVGNILKKAEGGTVAAVRPELLAEPAELALHAALARVQPVADAAFEAGDYTGSLKALAALKEPVDAFFEDVMVNADDPGLRTNRLGLLATLHAAMNRAADLSKLAA